ncbi:hypothetical protein [Roseateles sp.]|jgi:hypothetical protein|uniref:hypothetical protein n=1 Tax=Roseateles sp. TaxID=1971397 RepID=UPI003D0E39B2
MKKTMAAKIREFSISQGRQKMPPFNTNHLKTRITAILISIILTGCASTKSYVQAQTANDNSSLFYIARMHYPPTAWTGELIINGKVTAEVKDNSCVKVNIPNGKAEIGLKFGPMLRVSDETFTLTAKPNQTRYILMTGDVAVTGLGYKTIEMTSTFKVIELPTNGEGSVAAALIKSCQ